MVRPGHSVQPKIRLTESGTDLITILRCFLSYKTVVTPRNIIVFKINFSRPKIGHPSRARSLVPRAASWHPAAAGGARRRRRRRHCTPPANGDGGELADAAPEGVDKLLLPAGKGQVDVVWEEKELPSNGCFWKGMAWEGGCALEAMT